MPAVERPVVSPRDRVRLACGRWGEFAVVGECVALLRGEPLIGGDGNDGQFLIALGGPGGADLVARPVHAHWGRVWAARALLYAWHPMAAPAVIAALIDPQWRVREMAAKVCLRRELGEAADSLTPLTGDPMTRVRAAAARALAVVGEAEHAPALLALLGDAESVVRHRAEQALEALSRRLDRDFR